MEKKYRAGIFGSLFYPSIFILNHFILSYTPRISNTFLGSTISIIHLLIYYPLHILNNYLFPFKKYSGEEVSNFALYDPNICILAIIFGFIIGFSIGCLKLSIFKDATNNIKSKFHKTLNYLKCKQIISGLISVYLFLCLLIMSELILPNRPENDLIQLSLSPFYIINFVSTIKIAVYISIIFWFVGGLMYVWDNNMSQQILKYSMFIHYLFIFLYIVGNITQFNFDLVIEKPPLFISWVYIYLIINYFIWGNKFNRTQNIEL